MKRGLVIIVVVSCLMALGFGIFIGVSYDSAVQPASNAGDPKSVRTVKDYGAEGNGKKDDTASIQNAINEVSRHGGGIVLFPTGEYAVDATKSIILKDNITLKFDQGTTLLALPNDAERYSVITIQDANNVSLIGGVKIVGERNEHKGSQGEWGFGISIAGASNVFIQNPQIKDFWGDGIYIGSTSKRKFSENVTIVNPVCENNRRQGISVISAKKLDIINPKIFNTNGTAPQSGIDLEPNSNDEFLQDIRIINPVITGNRGAGVAFQLRSLSESPNRVNVQLINKSGIKDSIKVRPAKKMKGTIMIDNVNALEPAGK